MKNHILPSSEPGMLSWDDSKENVGPTSFRLEPVKKQREHNAIFTYKKHIDKTAYNLGQIRKDIFKFLILLLFALDQTIVSCWSLLFLIFTCCIVY